MDRRARKIFLANVSTHTSFARCAGTGAEEGPKDISRNFFPRTVARATQPGRVFTPGKSEPPTRRPTRACSGRNFDETARDAVQRTPYSAGCLLLISKGYFCTKKKRNMVLVQCGIVLTGGEIRREEPKFPRNRGDSWVIPPSHGGTHVASTST